MTGTFINQLPQNLAVSVRDQYDLLLPIFTKYAFSEDKNHYASVKMNYDLSCFFLEMALFYKNVVVPMSKGSDAFIGLHMESINTVRIGNYTLTNTDRNKIKNMERDFNSILIKYQIPIEILLFSDVKNFARDLNNFFSPQYE